MICAYKLTGTQYLTILPALLHSSLLALLSAAVPLSMTFSAILLAVTKSGDIVSNPSAVVAKTATSLHVLAFSSKGHLLLNESQGQFDWDTWKSIREKAINTCRNATIAGADGDIAMGEGADTVRLESFIRETVEDHLHRDYAWKIDSN